MRFAEDRPCSPEQGRGTGHVIGKSSHHCSSRRNLRVDVSVFFVRLFCPDISVLDASICKGTELKLDRMGMF